MKFRLLTIVLLFSFLSCRAYGHHQSKYIIQQNLIDIKKQRESTVLIKTIHSITIKEIEEKTFKKSGRGSGVIIEHNKNYSLILTVAHVCELTYRSQIRELLPREYQSGRIDKIPIQIKIETSLKVKDIAGNVYLAFPVLLSKQYDTCVLISEKIPYRNSVLSKRKPNIDETYYTMGFPLGIWARDFVPTFFGRYIGRLSRNRYSQFNAYSIPSAPGNSGSAVYNSKGEVVGILHSIFKDFKHISLVSTLWQTRATFQEAKKVLIENPDRLKEVIKKLNKRSIIKTPNIPKTL